MQMNTEALSTLSEQVAATLPQATVSIAWGEVNVAVAIDAIEPTLRTLRDDPRWLFETLIDVCGVDYPERAKRFDVVYHLLSMKKNIRIRVKLQTDEQAAVPSVAGLFPTANWFEREAFDMYGILFSGHPDLRRLLTDYGFSGHPLRKDFPLSGFVEVRYDDEQKRVVYNPVKLQQEFRSFDYLSPWEGAKAVPLPGDEKAAKP
ncbi:NADH-quinone oxidoreductase chain 5 [Alphaproteobacteria bacterium SO-S41]|nr:NADH-quinone oxidoreductase chain 5 [Alphaproteobacteria bacterium SO-S41]